MGLENFNKIGVKNVLTKNSIKIYGNPNLKVEKKLSLESFLKITEFS